MKRKPTILLATFVVTMGLLLGAGAEPEAAEIIGTWNSGIWYWDVTASEWTRMYPDPPDGDIAAGDFTGDGRDDVASIWTSGLFYQDAATLAWTEIPVDDPDGPSGVPNRLTAGDMNGDGRAEIIGSWSSEGFWYWDVVAENWTQMTEDSTNGDIAAGDFTNDGIADVASIWPDDGLRYQDGASLDWIDIPGSAPDSVTAGDVTGDGRPEIIGAWNSIWYWDVAESGWTKIDTVSPPTGDIAAGDFTGDGIADVAAIYDSGLWYVDGALFTWKKVTRHVPFSVTAGDVKSEAPSGVVQVFVTSSQFNGDLGGLDGADAKCQSAAEAAELPGTWVAWLSDGGDTNAIERIPDGQYRLLDETVIAEDKGDLIDGDLESPINRNEFGEEQGEAVWTGTSASGVGSSGDPCSNWTSQTGIAECSDDPSECAMLGNSNSSDFTWTQGPHESCSELASLYCFGGGE
jgi:hypothetical protein